MKNLIIIISLIVIPALRGMAQVSTLGNAGSSGDYVGWDNTNAFPLEIRHDGSQPMIFYTDGLEWMRLTQAGHLGIGTTTPGARVTVDHNPPSPSTSEIGLQVAVSPSTDQSRGGSFSVTNTSSGFGVISACGDLSDVGIQRGVLGLAVVDATGQAVGTEGFANVAVEDATVIGVRGIANAPTSESICGNTVVGVWGEVNSGIEISSTCNNVAWAGHFVGNVDVTGDVFEGSDEMLKQNIEPLTGALDLLNQLQPKTYEFRTSEFPMLNLPEGISRGLIAQEVEEVMPEIVRGSKYPKRYDLEGNVISEEFEYLTLSYTELIPLLLGGIQEQQDIIEAQETRLDDLETLIQNCCNLEKNLQSEPENDIKIDDKAKFTGINQNSPNPFESSTRISFSLAENCRAKVCIYNSSGQQIDCLTDEYKQSGMHSLEWNTSGLASGIYFYSLEIDGFEQVKRAVKL